MSICILFRTNEIILRVVNNGEKILEIKGISLGKVKEIEGTKFLSFYLFRLKEKML